MSRQGVQVYDGRPERELTHAEKLGRSLWMDGYIKRLVDQIEDSTCPICNEDDCVHMELTEEEREYRAQMERHRVEQERQQRREHLAEVMAEELAKRDRNVD